MLGKEVKNWLSEYKGLSPNEIHTFACTLGVNEDLIVGLIALFETAPYHVQELDPVCHQLYEFYRSKEEKLQLFSLQFVPTLVWLYLRCLTHGDKKICGGVETFLLGVYNLEIVKPDGTPVVENFRIPTISKPSVYHESRIPGVTEPLTEHALRSLNISHSIWRSGPYPQHERFNAQNRFSILSYVMQCFNNRIDSFHSHSLEALCKAAIKLCNAGFGKPQDSPNHPQPRNSVYPSLLVEYMVGVYFAMFKGHHKIAMKAVEATHHRASYELYSDVLLVTNAMLNSHHRGNFRYENFEVNLSSQKTTQALKNTITNASFKAKKLPDDIDIVEEDESQRLPTVDEDQEHTTAKGIKAKLLNIGGKFGVDKNKNRDNMRRDSDTPSVKSNSGADMADSVGVAVKSSGGSGGGKVVVDMLEMQPLKSKGANGKGHEEDGKTSGKSTFDEKSPRIHTSPLVFSKKSGILKQLSGSSAAHSDPSIKTLSYSSSPSAAGTAASASTPQGISQNGKAISSNSSSTVTNTSVNVKQNLSGKTITSDLTHSPRAQSEGPAVLDGVKLSSVKTSQLSSPSLLSSPTQSYPSSSGSNVTANSSEPVLGQHSSPRPQPTPSVSTHSMPAEILAQNSSSKAAQRAQINRNSFSTDL